MHASLQEGLTVWDTAVKLYRDDIVELLVSTVSWGCSIIHVHTFVDSCCVCT